MRQPDSRTPIVFSILAFLLTFQFGQAQTSESSSITSDPSSVPGETLPPADPNKLQKINYPYRVCSLATHGDLFRFSAEYDCPSYTQDKQHEEGILLVFKDNIIPHTFSVRTYAKIVTTTTVYSGYKYKAITNVFEESFPIEDYETEMIDSKYQCYNSVGINRNLAYQEYVDRDGKNETVNLTPGVGISNSATRYQSQPVVYSDAGTIWTYRRRTTVNCMITDVLAKSNSPFNFFATITGQTVEMSPFYNGSNNEPFNEKYGDFKIRENYTIVAFKEKDSLETSSVQPHRRAFIKKPTYSISWKLENKSEYCPLTMWQSFSKAIKTDTSRSFHFLAPEATATFVTSTDGKTSLETNFNCINQTISSELDKKFQEVSATHDKNGSHIYLKATGGLLLVWQPLIQKSLVSIKNLSKILEEETASTPTSPTSTSGSLRRRRREADAGSNQTPAPTAGVAGNTDNGSLGTVDTAAFLQVQFAYDRLKDQINQMLGDISRAWCLDQRRSNMVLNELTKINPTTVMTSIYGFPVAAKRLGDIISVSRCIDIDPTSVSLQKSLIIPGSSGLCYSRPLVSFKFYNDTKAYEGQLGANNEILLTKNMIENCAENAIHYFQSGDKLHVYSKYVHTRTINLTEINTLQTFITLNASLIENIDFKALEIYTREERRMSNVFDIESMLREYNFHTQNIIGMRRDLDNEISNNRNEFIDAMGEILESLGAVGGVIANAVSVVAGLFGSIISGVISFFKNPFGGFLILLLIGGVLVVIVLIVLKTRRISNSPVQVIYPAIDKIAQGHMQKSDEAVQPISKKELDRIMLALYYQNQEQQQAAKLEQSSSSKSWFLNSSSAVKESLAELRQRTPLRNRYQRLPTVEEEV